MEKPQNIREYLAKLEESAEIVFNNMQLLKASRDTIIEEFRSQGLTKKQADVELSHMLKEDSKRYITILQHLERATLELNFFLNKNSG